MEVIEAVTFGGSASPFWSLSRAGGNGDTTTKYEGTVSGGELKLKVTAPGRGGGDPVTNEVTAKKSTT